MTVNVDDAFYSLVHDYPGGSESLAPRMGVSASVLRSKALPHCKTHLPTVRDLRSCMALSGDLRPLHALCSEFDGVFIRMPVGDDGSDMAVLELIAAMWSRNGALGTAVHHALVDSVLSHEEMEVIKAAAYEAQQRMATLVNRLQAMAQPEERNDA